MKMKMHTAVGLIVVIGLAIGTGFGLVQQKKNLAEVQQMQGFYVFTDSSPVNEYEYLGTVKTGSIVKSVKHREIMITLLKNATKEFPEGDGIILSEDYFQADVIKFK